MCGVWCVGELFFVYVCWCLRESVRFFVFVSVRLCVCVFPCLCESVSESEAESETESVAVSVDVAVSVSVSVSMAVCVCGCVCVEADREEGPPEFMGRLMGSYVRGILVMGTVPVCGAGGRTLVNSPANTKLARDWLEVLFPLMFRLTTKSFVRITKSLVNLHIAHILRQASIADCCILSVSLVVFLYLT